MKFVRVKEIYLDNNSKYKENSETLYLNLEQVESIRVIDIDYCKNTYKVRFINQSYCLVSCDYFDEKLGES